MAPIKVGFIGLGATGWARGAHLPYLRDSGEYEIVAICNTSVASAEKVIALYRLPATTKAYGSPEDIAKDPDVELIACSVRVDRHLAALTPALKAGKNIVVEWPLGKSAAEARELLKLKNEGGVKSAEVVLQGRRAPIVLKVKSLVEIGVIGKILSSTVSAQVGNGGPTTTQQARYLGDKEVGGNLFTIHFAHAVDQVQLALGYGFKSPHALLQTRRETCTLMSDDGSIAEKDIPKTADDTMFITGTLSTGIPVSFNLLGGDPFPGTNGLEWFIYGEVGTIRLTAPGPFLQIGYPDMKIELHDFATNSVKNIAIPQDEFDHNAPKPGSVEFPYNPDMADFASLNMGRLYKFLATGASNCSFEDAVERHEFLEELYKQNGYIEP